MRLRNDRYTPSAVSGKLRRVRSQIQLKATCFARIFSSPFLLKLLYRIRSCSSHVSPPQCGGAIPAPLTSGGPKWRDNFLEGPDHPVAPNRLEIFLQPEFATFRNAIVRLPR